LLQFPIVGQAGPNFACAPAREFIAERRMQARLIVDGVDEDASLAAGGEPVKFPASFGDLGATLIM
jgi:hypothetical protein